MSTLAHYTRNDRDTEWTKTVMIDVPLITAASVIALRKRVAGRADRPGDKPLSWYHCDSLAWGAVTDLHQLGQHNDALALAQLLRWCDTQADARVRGYWELTP